MRFSTWLKVQIEDLEMDNKTAAKLFYCTRQTLYRWLHDLSFPTMENLKIIASAIAMHRQTHIDYVLDEIAQTIKLELSN
jgi:predicted DNA-binding transcriptional regulator AlpA